MVSCQIKEERFSSITNSRFNQRSGSGLVIGNQISCSTIKPSTIRLTVASTSKILLVGEGTFRMKGRKALLICDLFCKAGAAGV